MRRPSTSTGPRPPHVTKSRYAFRAGPGNTWLEVREGSATGKVLYAHVLSAGSHIRVIGRKLWVTAGRSVEPVRQGERPSAGLPSKVTGHLLVTGSDVRAVA